MTNEEIEEIMDGCAYLESLGNFYFYVGTKNGKLVFQETSSDYHIEISYEDLFSSKYSVQY